MGRSIIDASRTLAISMRPTGSCGIEDGKIQATFLRGGFVVIAEAHSPSLRRALALASAGGHYTVYPVCLVCPYASTRKGKEAKDAQ